MCGRVGGNAYGRGKMCVIVCFTGTCVPDERVHGRKVGSGSLYMAMDSCADRLGSGSVPMLQM